MSLLARLRPVPVALFILSFVLATTTGCFKRYTVIKQSGPPSALQGTTAMAVQFDTSNIAISKDRMSEQQWLETREKDEHRANYTDSLQAANTNFLSGLQSRLNGVALSMGQAQPGQLQITVSYTWWEEGMYAGVVAWPSEATARVMFSRDGEVLDEIEVKTKEDANLGNADPRARFRTIGTRLGQFTAQFINDSMAAAAGS